MLNTAPLPVRNIVLQAAVPKVGTRGTQTASREAWPWAQGLGTAWSDLSIGCALPLSRTQRFLSEAENTEQNCLFLTFFASWAGSCSLILTSGLIPLWLCAVVPPACAHVLRCPQGRRSSLRFSLFHLQSMKVKLQPPSGTELSPFNPIQPPAAITQVMLLANPAKVRGTVEFILPSSDTSVVS